VAKATALYLYLVVFELVAIPAYTILLLGPSPLDQLPALVAVLALANLGIAAIGALVAALAAEARARDLLVPLLLLPFLTPVLIAAARATEPLFAVQPETGDLTKWLGVLALYDLVFMLLAVAVFDFLLED
jgi:heme exporter protein B